MTRAGLLLTPPARAHFTWKAFCASWRPCEWEKAWLARFQARRVYGFGSARAALAELLIFLKRSSSRIEVVIPAYTCPSVPEAIAFSGLRPILCDTVSQGSAPDLDRLASLMNGRVLAVMTTNLWGLPDPVEEIRKIARNWGAWLIEDLSGSMGNSLAGQPLGCFGDAVFVSLGWGKVLTTGGGGILAIRKSGVDLDANPGHLSRRFCTLRTMVVLLLYPILISRFGFAGLHRLPSFQSLDSCVQTQESDWSWSLQQAILSARLLETMDASFSKRKVWGRRLHALIERSRFKNLQVRDSIPAYLRFPFLAGAGNVRDELIRKLRSQGVWATEGFENIRSYLRPEEHPNALALCDQLVTLPSHESVTERTLASIEAVIWGTTGAERFHQAAGDNYSFLDSGHP